MQFKRRGTDGGDASARQCDRRMAQRLAPACPFGGVAIAMGLGSYFGGLRVTEVLAEKVMKMNHAEGLSANLTTSSLVLVSGSLELPVSTTHVSSSAIIGIGLLKGWNSVHWTTVRDMVLA